VVTLTADRWAYHVQDALDMCRAALIFAHSNRHSDFIRKEGRQFAKICWFNLGVIILQSSWSRLSCLMRDRLLVTEWRGGRKPQKVTDRNTNLDYSRR
jgi:hypothetical protein